MIEDIKLPEISENVESGEVIDVLVKVGDFVREEQSVVELETEKAAFEVPSPVHGRVAEILVKEHDKVTVGQVMLKVDTAVAVAEPARTKSAPTKPAPEPGTPEPETPATGRTEEPRPPAGEPQTGDYAPAETPQETIARQESRTAAQPSGRVREDDSASPAVRPPAGAISAAPSVRQLARELGIDIALVTGSGAAGRITVDDVKRYARSVITVRRTPSPTAVTRPLPDFPKWGPTQRQAQTVTRKTIAEVLSYAWSTIPQVTQCDRADISALEEFRGEYAPRVEQAGGKLTITSILVKVVALALRAFPKFNASLDSERSELILKKYYHISVAVDTDRGLVVPVIRDADRKTILELSVELTQLAARARQNKLTPDDMVGGNFTVSNLGGLGGTAFSPIVYWPQVAILGVSQARREPVYINDNLEPRRILPLSLSYDHRVIDGSEGVRFLRWIAESLEKPFLLAVEG